MTTLRTHRFWTRLSLGGALLAGALLTVGAGSAAAGDDGGDAPNREAPPLLGIFPASYNWAGYIVQSSSLAPRAGSVSRVAGEWTVPAVVCGPAESYSSVWVGIDGYHNGTVEQIGTRQNCTGGQPVYGAFYQLYPDPLVPTAMEVHPGDRMQAQVRYDHDLFFLTLTNTSNGQHITVARSCRCERSSAEWIVETPTGSDGVVLDLANIGGIPFRNASVTINGTTGDIDDGAWNRQAVTMVDLLGVALAQPSLLGDNGSSFSVSALGVQ